jgi:hypothetical protein
MPKRRSAAYLRTSAAITACPSRPLTLYLSKLAVWLNGSNRDIRSRNGRHERMHLTLKKEATKPASGNFLQQQARFDKFMEVFNTTSVLTKPWT